MKVLVALSLAVIALVPAGVGMVVEREGAVVAVAARLEARAVTTSLPAIRSLPVVDDAPEASPTGSPSPSESPSPSAAAGARERSVDPSRPCGRSGARTVRFRVLVEDGLPTTPEEFASRVYRILCDRRSWTASGRVRFVHDPDGRLLVSLRTPESTERRCRQLTGLSVRRYYSCAGSREAVLNSDRWFRGSDHWPGGVTRYRHLLVNHEVGHTLGQRHRGCSRGGGPAPVMMQQSKGLGGCEANSWPLDYELRSLR